MEDPLHPKRNSLDPDNSRKIRVETRAGVL